MQRVGILCSDPLLGLCARAVFKPAIVIHDFYAVVLICYRPLYGSGYILTENGRATSKEKSKPRIGNCSFGPKR